MQNVLKTHLKLSHLNNISKMIHLLFLINYKFFPEIDTTIFKFFKIDEHFDVICRDALLRVNY